MWSVGSDIIGSVDIIDSGTDIIRGMSDTFSMSSDIIVRPSPSLVVRFFIDTQKTD